MPRLRGAAHQAPLAFAPGAFPGSHPTSASSHPASVSEFIHLISSEANEICEQESKKTIAPEHIISALKRLGFESFTDEVESVLKDHKQQQKDRERKVNKMEQCGLSEAELLAQQEALFAKSREKFLTTQQ
ncbi:hypothetical protein NUW54_g8872 [Trametes sanguinea]|uniref:Uncharacterized protein n=1 Tax=Trametes sanguinea TaxID=158606 RepID=A0ACC1PBQ1_9APHY|nr:hypothetical protein NUW54_g8872 [Trametes sanguinea]